MITWLLNIVSSCFFFSEIIKMHRRWRARENMQSTSLEGTILHFIGNLGICVIGFWAGAWLTVGMEGFLAATTIITIYWKFKWLILKYNLHFQWKFHLHYECCPCENCKSTEWYCKNKCVDGAFHSIYLSDSFTGKIVNLVRKIRRSKWVVK